MSAALHACTLRRGRRALVADLDLMLEPGTVTAILGPNGAGKSTALRLLAGDWRPDGGDVTFAGRSLAEWSPENLARVRAVVPQSTALPFSFTAREVVALGRVPHRRASSRRQDEEVVTASLAAADALPFADQPFPLLSGGERQRVALARALAQIWDQPRVGCCLLLDEPTAALDPAHQVAVMALLRRLADEGLTIGVVLHDLTLALRHADRAALLERGRLSAAGPVRAVLDADRLARVYGCALLPVDLPGNLGPAIVHGWGGG